MVLLASEKFAFVELAFVVFASAELAFAEFAFVAFAAALVNAQAARFYAAVAFA
jgi:hypothetical protein